MKRKRSESFTREEEELFSDLSDEDTYLTVIKWKVNIIKNLKEMENSFNVIHVKRCLRQCNI